MKNCHEMKMKLADLLLDPQSVTPEVRRHIEDCVDCTRELAELRSTMSLMDEYATPEITPFFDARLLARLRAEQQAVPAGFVERWKARWTYGMSLRMQPLMAGALALVVLVGGGTYADLAWQSSRTQESATVRDLQSLDGNAQVLQQLDSVDQLSDSSTDQTGQDSETSSGSQSSD